jgi:hypothetical protein
MQLVCYYLRLPQNPFADFPTSFQNRKTCETEKAIHFPYGTIYLGLFTSDRTNTNATISPGGS